MFSQSDWENLPRELLENVCCRLAVSDIANCSQTCNRWRKMLVQNSVWSKLLMRDFDVREPLLQDYMLKTDLDLSWRQHYQYLRCNVPSVMVDTIKEHHDEVLHVSFSHNGVLFATCSKDGYVKCWNTMEFPVDCVYQADMVQFLWKFPQFSAFNSSDTLLLVSGVHFGPLSSTGEIIIFGLDDKFTVQSRVLNDPYDVFGAWLDDNHLFSGHHHWVGFMEACCSLWISKASQELDSERTEVIRRAYKFLSVSGSSLRTLVIAQPYGQESEEIFIIFSAGSRTYIPHQIGIKRLLRSEVPMPGTIPQRSLQEAVEEYERSINQQAEDLPELSFDAIDHLFDLDAQVVGLSLSSDQRYLFVSCRGWPDGVHIENPMTPPPISSQIEIRTLDLKAVKFMENSTYRGPRGFTPSDECFYIFTDSSSDFIASGAEDKKAYIWHRHHRCLLTTLNHDRVVNAVAFCPVDQEILVTVSDDHRIRLWFSRRKCRELNIQFSGQEANKISWCDDDDDWEVVA